MNREAYMEALIDKAADETEVYGRPQTDTQAKLAAIGFSLPTLPAAVRNILNSRRTFFAA